MSAYLYLNYKGQPVTVHSHSSGARFEACPRDYRYEKIDGWRRNSNKASLKFGICLEEGLMFYHLNGLKPDDGATEFKRRWLAFKDDTTMQFTAKENSWADLYIVGSQMLRLYEILLPTLPIKDPVFQLNYKREVFPGTELAGIEHTAFADMVSKAPWSHPMLSKVAAPKGSAYRPLLIDIKTSATPLDSVAQYLSLDPQLREYGWTSGIHDLAFLYFVKARPFSGDRGEEFTILQDTKRFKAGDKVVVLATGGQLGLKEAKDASTIGFIPTQVDYAFSEAVKTKGVDGKPVSGKALVALKKQFIADFGEMLPVGENLVTRQRIQFAAARITDEDMLEVGQAVGKQIVEIVEAGRTGIWPKKPSVRFPSTKCVMCDKRGLCLNRPDLVEKLLVQIKPSDVVPERESDWLDDFESVE